MNSEDKKKLDDTIVSVFKHNPTAKTLHVIPDGNCFLEDKKGAANAYAHTVKSEVITVTRDEYAEQLGEDKKSAKELKAEEAAKKKAEEDADVIAKKEAEAKAKAEEEARDLATGKESKKK